MIALIDADIVVYQSAFASQEATDFGDGQLILTANVQKAIALAEEKIATIMDFTNADSFVLCFSCPSFNFRKAFWPGYKEQRKKVLKPLSASALRKHLTQKWPDACMVRPSLEADDIMGILATAEQYGFTIRGHEGPKVICSIDKDMASVPGFNYNWDRPGRPMEWIGRDRADLNFYTQVLVGDSVDNYPGLKGVGKRRAALALNDHTETERDMWEAVVSEYKRRGQTEEDAITQARCARILRACDWDWDKKEVRPWHPKNIEERP